jgi:anti-sigma B factor antagonist
MTATVISLGPELTIPYAAVHHLSLLEKLADDGDLALDLAGVSDFDSAGVQLLLSTRRTLAERGDALHIVGASAAVRDALELFGLADLMAEPATTGSE